MLLFEDALHFIEQAVDRDRLGDVTRRLNVPASVPSAVTVTTGMDANAGTFCCSSWNFHPSITGILSRIRSG